MTDDNPYAAPLSHTPQLSKDSTGGWRWGLAWSVVFAANLVIPVLFGWDVTAGGGRIGMALGTIFLYVVGFWVAGLNRETRAVALSGGTIVALSQFVPALQVLAGLIALRATGNDPSLGDDGSIASPPSETAGVFMAAITGGLLMLPAVFFGVLIRLGWKWFQRRRARAS